MVQIGIDMTAQKNPGQPSPESARTELAHIAAAGELIASIAHEISQPITCILASGYASQHWLSMQPPHLDEAREAVAQIIREADRAREVIARTRDLSIKNPLQQLPPDVNETIPHASTLAPGGSRTHGIAVHTEFASDLPAVLGDPISLQQVMLNLITNGVDAMSSVSGRRRKLCLGSARDPTGF